MRIKMKRFLGILLTLTLVLGLMPGMSLTMYASTLTSESTTWSENSDIVGDVTINNNVTVNDDITLTIPAGKTLTINGQSDYDSIAVINDNSHTLTVCGGGTLIVNAPAEEEGHHRVPGIDGNLIVDGATVQVTGGAQGVFGNVTVKSGLVCVNGGNGKAGGNAYDGISGVVIVNGGSITVVGGNGGNGDNGDGGSGGDGVTGDVIVNGGSATITGGNGGTKGSDYASNGCFGQAVYGSITGNAEESEDNINWTSVTGSASQRQYIKFVPILVTGVSLDKTTAQTIDVDGKVFFTATVTPENASDKTVKWSVGGTNATAVKLYSDENCTTEVGTDATSTLTVYAKGISAGNATVTCTSNADSTKSASCDVTVNANAGNPYASLVNTTTSVKFNEMDWYIIADNSTAVDAGTVTLLAADTSFGLSKFHGSSNDYSSSTVKGVLDNLTESGGSFAGVADAIMTNTDAGGKLYLLSKDDTQNLSSAVLRMNFNSEAGKWWLRSSASHAGEAMYVLGINGIVNDSGAGVSNEYGVRPALKLDLSKVTFDSLSNTFTYNASSDTSVASVTKNGQSTEYSSIGEALNAWSEGSTLTLLDDVAVEDNCLQIIESKTLNTNGKTLTITNDSLINGISIVKNVTLTVTGTGTLNVKGGAANHMAITGDGTLIVDGATVNATGHNGDDENINGCTAISIATLIVNSGTIKAIGGNGTKMPDNGGIGIVGKVTINGGEVYAIGGTGNGTSGLAAVANTTAGTGKVLVSKGSETEVSDWSTVEAVYNNQRYGYFTVKDYISPEDEKKGEASFEKADSTSIIKDIITTSVKDQLAVIAQAEITHEDGKKKKLHLPWMQKQLKKKLWMRMQYPQLR